MSSGGRGRAIVLAAAALALVVLARVLPVQAELASFQAWVAARGAWGAVLYTVVYALAALLFIPGSLLTIAAGLLFGLFWGTVIVSIASTTTAALAFLIARHLARARVERVARRHPTFAAIDRAIREQGWKMVALLRLSPLVPFNVSNYLYGLTPVAFGPYLLASWIAMLPGTLLYVYLGAAGRAAAQRQGKSPLEWALFAAGLLATAAVTLIIGRAARRELAKARVNGDD